MQATPSPVWSPQQVAHSSLLETYAPTATTTLTGTATVSRLEQVASVRAPLGSTDNTAIALNDGTALVASGVTNFFVKARSALYDPVTQSAAPIYDDVLGLSTATRLADGSILFIGGQYDLLSRGDILRFGPTTNGISFTGSTLNEGRLEHTATLLVNGKILITGGFGGYDRETILRSAEIYDPATGVSVVTGALSEPRTRHTATLLHDGNVLIVGGNYEAGNLAPRGSAEIYDPATNRFTTTATMQYNYPNHQATLLNDGRVLVTGGARGEIFDPTTKTWSAVEYRSTIYTHTATLLRDGRVLILSDGGEVTDAYIFDPVTNRFSSAGNVPRSCSGHTAARLLNDHIVIGCPGLIDEEQVASNVFTGTLTLPSGWVATATPTITVSGITSNAPIAAGSVNDGPWFTLQPSVVMTITLPSIANGRAQAVTLRLRDTDGAEVAVVGGHVDIDTSPPSGTATVTAVNASRITVHLQASDQTTLSGIADMRVSTDVHFRDTDWQAYVTSTVVPRMGGSSEVYTQFRDRAGNMSTVYTATIQGFADVQVFLPFVGR